MYLKGRLWKCICGHWCFDVCFTSIGDGPDFNLSDVLPDRSELQITDWKGCDGLYIEMCVSVPPGTIPVERCGTLYQVGAKFELRCCGDCDDEGSHVAVAGHEPRASTCSSRPDPGPLRHGTGPRPAQLGGDERSLPCLTT